MPTTKEQCRENGQGALYIVDHGDYEGRILKAENILEASITSEYQEYEYIITGYFLTGPKSSMSFLGKDLTKFQ